ncbi:MAG: hypothetical protein CME69_04735 [Halobacteriovorax sp.]|nr:hypothetical protein [Halobacteriovorax sp.]
MNVLYKVIFLLMLINISNANNLLSDINVDEVSLSDIFAGEEYSDFVDNAYSSEDLIEKALDERFQYQYEQRIEFLRSKTHEIIAHSGMKNNELLLRMTLERTYKFADIIEGLSLNNTEEDMRWLAGFYKDGFEFAKILKNSNYILVSDTYLMDEYDRDKLYLTSAEYGRQHALRIWEHSTGLQSDRVKAILLVKLVSYLGNDLKNDLRRREGHIIKSLADVYHLQRSRSYQSVKSCLMTGKEILRADIVKLRRSIYTVITDMNSRF